MLGLFRQCTAYFRRSHSGRQAREAEGQQENIFQPGIPVSELQDRHIVPRVMHGIVSFMRGCSLYSLR
ncbi:MAG TPA: hypothetical protein DDX85_07840 [Nitrospiraceae bacterium]|nr:hypothetical protein [Nitrospiraceae bacterium]